MTNNTQKSNVSSKRRIAIVAIIVLLVGILVSTILISFKPERTVDSFCHVAKEEKAILQTGGGNYEQRVKAYSKLEAVSPDDIRSDITTIRKGYESIVQNPSNTISAGMGMSGAETRRTDYITKNCTDF